MVANVSEESAASIFTVEKLLMAKSRGSNVFQISGNDLPDKLCHITEGTNLQMDLYLGLGSDTLSFSNWSPS
jgi:hypothetical protein